VVEFVLGLDADQQRRVTVLFEDDCRYERSFETVSAVLSKYAAKRETSGAADLPVVRNGSEVMLDSFGTRMISNDLPLLRGEIAARGLR
jgi:hypothetical protein